MECGESCGSGELWLKADWKFGGRAVSQLVIIRRWLSSSSSLCSSRQVVRMFSGPIGSKQRLVSDAGAGGASHAICGQEVERAMPSFFFFFFFFF